MVELLRTKGGRRRVRSWSRCVCCPWRRYRSVINVIAWPIRKRKKRWRGRCGVGGSSAPVVACVREAKVELLDGFKRWTAARQIGGLTSLSVRVLEVDEQPAKAAILGLNRDQRPVRELEEAWVVQGLVRDDGMTQVEAAHLLGRHKSWVCRRLALLEKLSVAVKEDLRLGLLGPALARQLTRLPAGNQEALLALTRRETLTAGSERRDRSAARRQRRTGGVRAGQAARGVGAVQGMPAALRDPRLSRAGNWLARH